MKRVKKMRAFVIDYVYENGFGKFKCDCIKTIERSFGKNVLKRLLPRYSKNF
jgi:hypothetical protein